MYNYTSAFFIIGIFISALGSAYAFSDPSESEDMLLDTSLGSMAIMSYERDKIIEFNESALKQQHPGFR